MNPASRIYEVSSTEGRNEYYEKNESESRRAQRLWI